MTMLLTAVAAIVCDLLTYLPNLSWLSFIGLAAGTAAWAWGVQMRKAYPPGRFLRLTTVLGIFGTFGGLAGILISFTLVSLLYGGIMVF